MSPVVSILWAAWSCLCSGCSYLRAAPVHFLLDAASLHTTSDRWCSTLEVTSSKGFTHSSQIRPWLVWGEQPEWGALKGSRMFSIRAAPVGPSQPLAVQARWRPLRRWESCTKPAWASALTCKQRLWKSQVVSLSPLKQTSSAVCFGRLAAVSAAWAWIFCLSLWPLKPRAAQLPPPGSGTGGSQSGAFLSRSAPPLTLSSPSVVRCPIEHPARVLVRRQAICNLLECHLAGSPYHWPAPPAAPKRKPSRSQEVASWARARQRTLVRLVPASQGCSES